MNEVIKTIIDRRSVRKFNKKEVSEEDLELIMLAGRYAPSAKGAQPCKVLVVDRDSSVYNEFAKLNLPNENKDPFLEQTNYL